MASYDREMSFSSKRFYEEKRKYRTIRSVLSAILPKINGQAFGKDDCISIVVTYDPIIILQYMDSLHENLLSMDILTKKLCTLLCLLSS